MSQIKTYFTKYGKISLYANEVFIGEDFERGFYWEEDTLIKLKAYIDPEKNILEIGGHCGTSSIVYSSFIKEVAKCYVFEPQNKLFELLELNVRQNDLHSKIECFNKGVFCYTGCGVMNDIDLDGGGGNIKSRLNEEDELPCNFGGVSMGRGGEQIELTTVDEMSFENIGFIHCDAQGAESFIFSNSVETITKHRPVIFFENNRKYCKYLFETVCDAYPEFSTESEFDVTTFCMDKLGYIGCIEKFNGGIDTLLIP